MIWNLCIRRPVLTVVVFLVVAIFGGWGYVHLPVRETPDVDFPIVTVNVVLPGAEPEVVETEIIEPLESQLNTIEGLKELRSTAREQVGTITAEFELWRDIDIAVQDVRDRVNRARRELPDEVEAPLVQKLDPDAFAIMWLTLTGDRRWNEVRLSEYARNRLKERLESIRGVGQIQIGGERRFAVRIRLDPERLAAHGLTVQDVVRTIQQNNVDIPSGRIESEAREFLVETRGQFASPEPFNDLVLTRRAGGTVRLADVGRAVAGVENDRQLARFNGEPTVGLGVVKQSDANMVELANTVRQRMTELAEEFPPGLGYRIAADNSTYVEQSIRDLVLTIFAATALVVLVVLFFLRTPTGTVIPSLAIPTSLLAGIAVIYALGFSLNTLTLLALILVIGIVVDDAIVILESSFRHLEQGADRVPAARSGTTEVAFAAIANSLSLLAVFIPVAFTAGLIGRFFFEFGLTVAVTIAASTLTALTLTAMLSSRMLRLPKRQGLLYRFTERILNAVDGAYHRTIDLALRHRGLTLLVGLVAFAGGILSFTQLSKEFSPDVDRAEFMIRFETPEGSTLAQTDAYARQVEQVLDEMAEIDRFFLAIGLSRAGPGEVNQGISFIHLVPREQRGLHQSEVMQRARERLAALPGGQAYVLDPGGGMGQQAPLEVVLQHPELEQLSGEQERLMGWMRSQTDFVDVKSDTKLNRPQVSVRVDRDRAADLGLSVADVSNTLRILLGEPEISEVERANERYEVIAEVEGQGRMVPSSLGRLYARARNGALVPLTNVVDIEETAGPSEIHHFNRLRSVTISAATPPEVPLGEALSRLEQHMGKTLGAGVDYAVAGQAQDFRESFGHLRTAVIFAVLFILLVLAAQFESFAHALTILLALPLALVGAFGALWLFDMTFNVFTFIGLIMLLGMATKNAILLVDYSNILIARGKETIEAAREAAKVRLRPVLMTTFSTVLGMMPIALGIGAGGEARAPLGVAVAAGLLATTFLTLVVVPVAYTLVDGLRRRVLAKLDRAPRRARSAQATAGEEAG